MERQRRRKLAIIRLLRVDLDDANRKSDMYSRLVFPLRKARGMLSCTYPRNRHKVLVTPKIPAQFPSLLAGYSRHIIAVLWSQFLVSSFSFLVSVSTK